MNIYINPAPEKWATILARPAINPMNLSAQVQGILDQVQREGDQALLDFTERFDRVKLKDLAVSESELENVQAHISEELKEAINLAYQNIYRFHKAQESLPQKVETTEGVSCWRKTVPIAKVGLYIPGGTAPLFSTVLMLGVPAQIAGCRELVLCTPPRADGSIHPAILYTAKLVGCSQIFKVGGAQAIGAMAYGSKSIPKVYKIFGPGNQYVTAAKQIVQQTGTAIDMPAGPSEVLVLADDRAQADFVAADLLSQAEHGIDSQVVLLAYSQHFVQKVQAAIKQQLRTLPRQKIAQAALKNSCAIVVKDAKAALNLINEYAPEHLIISTQDADQLAEQVENAGSVFLGDYTPESAGDYASGTNHTLPTNGFAKAYSGVSLDSFVKNITFQKISPQGLKNIGKAVEVMAAAEQLVAHKNAVSIRLNQLKNQ